MKQQIIKTRAEDREIFKQIVDNYSSGDSVFISQALKEHPDWAEAIKHLNYGNISYHCRALKKVTKKRNIRASESQVVAVNTQTTSEERAITLNYCPGCGVHLANLQKTLELEAKGKI